MALAADAVTLEVKGLGLARGSRCLFADLDFSLVSGHALILRGPNGVGKTSLLRVLAGLTIADSGSVVLQAARVRAFAPHVRDNVLYIGHANALKDDLTVQENLADQLALDTNDVTLADQLGALDAVHLGDRRDMLARRLSQGQKRRVGLARLRLNCGLAHKSMWLLDEPTNALDEQGSALFVETVNRHLSMGGAAVIASHLPLGLSGPVAELQMQERA